VVSKQQERRPYLFEGLPHPHWGFFERAGGVSWMETDRILQGRALPTASLFEGVDQEKRKLRQWTPFIPSPFSAAQSILPGQGCIVELPRPYVIWSGSRVYFVLFDPGIGRLHPMKATGSVRVSVNRHRPRASRRRSQKEWRKVSRLGGTDWAFADGAGKQVSRKCPEFSENRRFLTTRAK